MLYQVASSALVPGSLEDSLKPIVWVKEKILFGRRKLQEPTSTKDEKARRISFSSHFPMERPAKARHCDSNTRRLGLLCRGKSPFFWRSAFIQSKCERSFSREGVCMLTVSRMTAAQHHGKSVVLWGANVGTAPPVNKMGPGAS